jgi:hypothetical protein
LVAEEDFNPRAAGAKDFLLSPKTKLREKSDKFFRINAQLC